jgi:hypothetical protein
MSPPFVWHSFAQVRRKSCGAVQQPSPLATFLHDVPHHVLRNAVTPNLASAYGSEDSSLGDASRYCPFVQRDFDPGGNRYSPDVPALARSTIAQCPWRTCTSFTPNPTSSDLRRPQPNSMASIASSRFARRLVPKACLRTAVHSSALSQFPDAEAKLLHAFHSADARRQFRRLRELSGERLPVAD